MLHPTEETQILRGIDTIFFNLRHVPVDDVAYQLVKFDQKLAEKLATHLNYALLDKDFENDE